MTSKVFPPISVLMKRTTLEPGPWNRQTERQTDRHGRIAASLNAPSHHCGSGAILLSIELASFPEQEEENR